MIKAFIYAITNKLNNKKYIGTTKYDIQQRYKEHVSRSKSSKYIHYPLYNAFRKYGLENFEISIIEECDENKMFEREIYYISLFDTYRGEGYNATIGGEGKQGVEVTDEKIIETYIDNGNKLYATSNKLNCNAETIRNILHKYGIPTNSFKQYNEDKIISYYKNGMSKRKIGEKYNLCEDTIANIIKRNNVKLKSEIIEEISKICSKFIVNLYKNKFTINKISLILKSTYKLSNYQIGKILHNNGIVTDRHLETRLKIENVKEKLIELKSISELAKYYCVSRIQMSKYLMSYNIKAKDYCINIPKPVVLYYKDCKIKFNNMVDCAKYLIENNLSHSNNKQVVRDSISKCIKNNVMYNGIKIERQKSENKN